VNRDIISILSGKVDGMDIVSIINTSVEILKKASEAAKKIKDAEVKNLLADLSLQLADAKMAIADIKEEMSKLREENLSLRAQKNKEEKPTVKNGCYIFDNDSSRLYCPTCYDVSGKKIMVADVMFVKKCNSCGGIFDAKH